MEYGYHAPEKSTRLFDLIPAEIIESWVRGEYLLGNRRSVGYDYIGWSLFVRGFYRYALVKREDDPGTRTRPGPAEPRAAAAPADAAPEPYSEGYCIIDLEDGELVLKGIRTAVNDPTEDQTYHTPGFFRSEFSKMILPSDRAHAAPRAGDDRGSRPIIYFGYRFYTVERRYRTEFADICEKKAAVCRDAAAYIQHSATRWIPAREEATVAGTHGAPGDSAPRDPEKERAWRLAVYDYMTDRRRGFEHHIREIQNIFEEYDQRSGKDMRRNLYAVIQLRPPRAAGTREGSANIVADFDGIPGVARGPQRGRLLLHRVDMLGYIEDIRTGSYSREVAR